MRLRRHLIVEARERLSVLVNVRDVLVELRNYRREDKRLRLALVVIAQKVVQFVFLDWTAESPTQLLILIGKDVAGDRVGRVHLVAAEIAGEKAAGDVSPGLRHS